MSLSPFRNVDRSAAGKLRLRLLPPPANDGDGSKVCRLTGRGRRGGLGSGESAICSKGETGRDGAGAAGAAVREAGRKFKGGEGVITRLSQWRGDGELEERRGEKISPGDFFF